MGLHGEYEPSPREFVVDQVRKYEATGGGEGGTVEGKPFVILTTRGRRSGCGRLAFLRDSYLDQSSAREQG